MFLKTDTFTYGGHSAALSELSALQRVDYLMFIQSRTAEYDALPETLTEQERQAAFMQMGVDINAWLVSRSLCESKKEDDARHLYDAVRAQWSFHSHPDGLPFLSDVDRRLQVQSGLPWWLVCDDRIYTFRCVPFLTGRAFEHGVTDCYTLFRDAYHLAGIEMPDFARREDWWKQGDNLYLDNLEATGFYRVNAAEAQPGDILMCCFGSSVANHAAIYCGDGELLHHIPDQLSKRERYSEKWQRRTHSIWRHRAWHESAFTGIYNDLVAASASV